MLGQHHNWVEQVEVGRLKVSHSSSQLEPPRSSTPIRSPIKSLPSTRTHTHKRAELLSLLEQTVVVLLAQTSHYLADQSVQHHDKLKLKKELASELVCSCKRDDI